MLCFYTIDSKANTDRRYTGVNAPDLRATTPNDVRASMELATPDAGAEHIKKNKQTKKNV